MYMSLFIYKNKKTGANIKSKRRLHSKNYELIQEIRSTDINNQDERIWRQKDIQPKQK